MEKQLTPIQHLQNLYLAARMARLTADEFEQIKLSVAELDKFIKAHSEKKEDTKQ